MTDRDTLRTAAQHLEPELLAVWTLKHIQGFGRRRGAAFLEISQDAWRWRLNQADRIMQPHLTRKENAA